MRVTWISQIVKYTSSVIFDMYVYFLTISWSVVDDQRGLQTGFQNLSIVVLCIRLLQRTSITFEITENILIIYNRYSIALST